MGDKWIAVLGLVACGGVWLGMALGPARRQWLRSLGLALWLRLRQTLRSPAQARQARREADDAINRARGAPKVDREGNVYRPDSCKRPRNDRDKLH